MTFDRKYRKKGSYVINNFGAKTEEICPRTMSNKSVQSLSQKMKLLSYWRKDESFSTKRLNVNDEVNLGGQSPKSSWQTIIPFPSRSANSIKDVALKRWNKLRAAVMSNKYRSETITATPSVTPIKLNTETRNEAFYSTRESLDIQPILTDRISEDLWNNLLSDPVDFRSEHIVENDEIIQSLLQSGPIPSLPVATVCEYQLDTLDEFNMKATSNIMADYISEGNAQPIKCQDSNVMDNPQPEYHSIEAVYERFQTEIAPHMLVINKIPAHVIEEYNAKLNILMRNQKLKQIQDAKDKEMKLLQHQQEIERKLNDVYDNQKAQYKIALSNISESLASNLKAMRDNFIANKDKIAQYLNAQKATLKEIYGQLQSSHGPLGQSTTRKYFIRSKTIPQPIEVRVHLLRSVKTKLHEGSYVVMLTQYDSLGGVPLSWTELGMHGIGSNMPAVTKPVFHNNSSNCGKLNFGRVLSIEDSCFALCPSKADAKPGYVLVFELFELASPNCPHDRVVGWAAIPMCNENLSIIRGKFKLPLLRGTYSPALSHFGHINDALSTDLSNWLCNMYFEVRHLPVTTLHEVPTHIWDPISLEFDYLSKTIQTFKKNEDGRHNLPSSSAMPVNNPVRASMAEIDSTHHADHMVAPLKLQSISSGSLKSSLHSTSNINFASHSASIVAASSSSTINSIIEFHVPHPSTPRPHETSNLTLCSSNESSTLDLSSPNRTEMKRVVKSTQPRTTLDLNMNVFRRIISKHISNHAIVPLASELPLDLNLTECNSDSQVSSSVKLIQRLEEGNVLKQCDDFIENNGYQITKGTLAVESNEMLESEANVFKNEETCFDANDEESCKSESETQTGASDTIDKPGNREYRTESDNQAWQSQLCSINQLSHPQSHKQTLSQSQMLTHFMWRPLTCAQEMELYSPALISDPSTRAKCTSTSIVRSKLKYLYMEACADLDRHSWGTFNYYATIALILAAVWVRLFVHFFGQYLLLMAIPTPIYGFSVEPLFIRFKYQSSALTTANEIGVVAFGTVTCLIVFALLAVIGVLFFKMIKYVPESYSKFVLFFGLATIFDPLLIALVDLFYHNYDCAATSSYCAESYSQSACQCYNGDFYKLWYRMVQLENSGITGLLITLQIYFTCIIVTSLSVYFYLVNFHRDGHILDIWKRVNADTESVFVPNDFEISYDELRSICLSAAQWHGIDGSLRKVYLTSYLSSNGDSGSTIRHIDRDNDRVHEFDMTKDLKSMNFSPQKLGVHGDLINSRSNNEYNLKDYIKHYRIYEINLENEQKLLNQFIILSTGSIIEIFDHAVGNDLILSTSLLANESN